MDTPVLVTQLNPQNPNLGKVLRKNWNIIKSTSELSEIFEESLMIGYRRLPNLRELLTSIVIQYPTKSAEDNPTVITHACSRLGECTYCPKI